jgi:hypothetical protein
MWVWVLSMTQSMLSHTHSECVKSCVVTRARHVLAYLRGVVFCQVSVDEAVAIQYAERSPRA